MKKGYSIRKKIAAAVMAGVMTIGMAACGSSDSGTESKDKAATADSSAASSEADTEDGTAVKKAAEVTPMQMSVNKESGEMTISRPELDGTSMGADGTWTIFLYICGSDLESGGGAAFADITEMTQAAQSDKVRFVVQTGGASQWSSELVDPNPSVL